MSSIAQYFHNFRSTFVANSLPNKPFPARAATRAWERRTATPSHPPSSQSLLYEGVTSRVWWWRHHHGDVITMVTSPPRRICFRSALGWEEVEVYQKRLQVVVSTLWGISHGQFYRKMIVCLWIMNQSGFEWKVWLERGCITVEVIRESCVS